MPMRISMISSLIVCMFFLLLSAHINCAEAEWKNRAPSNDFRNIATGWEIPSEGYCDQPYIVVNANGSWLCVLTTGTGREGLRGQHVVACISDDKGKTWSDLIDIEPADGPEASWVVPLQTPSGRVYAIYTYNADDMREVLNYMGEPIRRVDTLGKLMYKYSDDGGRSWSKERYELPMRTFEIDRNNIYRGKVQFFWSVSKPIIADGAAYMGMAKVGNFGDGFMHLSEGVILKSENVLTEFDPSKIVWETLPDGDVGLRPPAGKVADEHNLVSLSDGSLYCTYRTNQGRNCHAYSRDGDHTWTPPAWATYTPGGKLMKQPRAFNKVYKFSNGKYLLFFHNNGARHYASSPQGNRNPTWLSGGIEKDGYIHWSQPEIFLYDDD